MSTSLYYSGLVELKPGVTPEQIAEAYKTAIEDSEVTISELGYAPGVALTDSWYDTSVDLSVSDGLFTYVIDFDGNGSNTWGDKFEDFLDVVATQFAAKGWINYLGHEPDQSQEPYGPDEVAKASAMLVARATDLSAATQAYQTAWAAFGKAVADAAVQ